MTDNRELPQEPERPARPPLSPISAAFREGLLACLEEPFNNAMLSKLMRMAEAARDWLRAETPKPEDFHHTTDVLGAPENDVQLTPLGIAAAAAGAGALNAETFGARMLREMLPKIMEITTAGRQTPDALVMAIASARSMGMYDVAAKLEEKLTGEKATPERIEQLKREHEAGTADKLRLLGIPSPGPTIEPPFASSGKMDAFSPSGE